MRENRHPAASRLLFDNCAAALTGDCDAPRSKRARLDCEHSDEGERAQRVFVSFGSVDVAQLGLCRASFVAGVCEALRKARVQVVAHFLADDEADSACFEQVAAHSFVDEQAAMRSCDAVLHHGGAGTTHAGRAALRILVEF